MNKISRKEYVYRSWLQRFWSKDVAEAFTRTMEKIRNVDRALIRLNEDSESPQKANTPRSRKRQRPATASRCEMTAATIASTRPICLQMSGQSSERLSVPEHRRCDPSRMYSTLATFALIAAQRLCQPWYRAFGPLPASGCRASFRGPLLPVGPPGCVLKSFPAHAERQRPGYGWSACWRADYQRPP